MHRGTHPPPTSLSNCLCDLLCTQTGSPSQSLSPRLVPSSSSLCHSSWCVQCEGCQIPSSPARRRAARKVEEGWMNKRSHKLKVSPFQTGETFTSEIHIQVCVCVCVWVARLCACLCISITYREEKSLLNTNRTSDFCVNITWSPAVCRLQKKEKVIVCFSRLSASPGLHSFRALQLL